MESVISPGKMTSESITSRVFFELLDRILSNLDYVGDKPERDT
jgi:hypothetical protein